MSLPIRGAWHSILGIAILMAMKRVSVAEAKNGLPALLREAESGPIEIVRRGKPVAVILARAEYDRLSGRDTGVWAAIQSFRKAHELEELDANAVFTAGRDRKATGRPVRW